MDSHNAEEAGAVTPMQQRARNGKESERIALARDSSIPQDVLDILLVDKSMLVREQAQKESKRRGQGGKPAPPLLMVSTDSLPGYTITKVLGLVSSVDSDAVWTASSKGQNALDASIAALVAQAKSINADAIIGLHMAAYGARGGVTSMVGGDAVGVIVWGTAVQASREPDLGHPRRSHDDA